MRRNAKGTEPGPNIRKAKTRSSKLIQAGRSLPPSQVLGDMEDKLPKHFWQTAKFRFWRRRVVLTLVSLIVIVGGLLSWKFYDTISSLFHGGVLDIFSTTKLRGEDSGHVNILIAGYSADDPGHNGASLTDSIMLASLNTDNHTAFLLSIPRDLWVDIPGFGQAKINEAYQDGERQDGNFNDGMRLLSQVVSTNFGLPIDYWSLVNYAAIRDSVNAVGGINVTINSCDPRGLNDPNIDWSTGKPLIDHLKNGTHHLNGEQALNLARARGDPSPYGIAYGFCGAGGDFVRTNYQRQMLIALKNKITEKGTLLNPLKLSNLLDAIGKNVKTNFTTPEIHRLYNLSKSIDSNKVKSYGLNDVNGKPLVMGANYGKSVQIPTAGPDDFSQIKSFVNSLMNPPAASNSATY